MSDLNDKINQLLSLDIKIMTVEDFQNLPHAGHKQKPFVFDTLIILPTEYTHDSEFQCMDFVACLGATPICRLSGNSDVLHLNGIGGYGIYDSSVGIPAAIPPISWTIDCLPTSKLLRLFSLERQELFTEGGYALSSFSIYCKTRQ